MGQLDILINNAALFTAAPIVEITRADYDKLFAVNVAGTLFCTAGRRAPHDRAGQGRQDHQHGLARPGGGARGWSPSTAPPRPPSSA